ncbi:MAG: peroxide stress protein YaaA [Rubrivivax sp.]
MLTLLSPAKRLDFESPIDAAITDAATRPHFAADAATLIHTLRRKTPAQVAALMHLSDALATLNVERYAAWRPRATPRNSRPGLLAFAGDVYVGVGARSLDARALDWAQDHVAILSGLYGVLRPLDRVQPYRLEMGTRLATEDATDLYGYWGDRLARHLDRRLRGQAHPVLLNLASQEYFRAVDRAALEARVVHAVFEDAQPDAADHWRVVGVLAKRARGRLAGHVVRQRIDDPAALRGWRDEGYALAAKASTPDRLVFRRRQRAPAAGR